MQIFGAATLPPAGDLRRPCRHLSLAPPRIQASSRRPRARRAPASVDVEVLPRPRVVRHRAWRPDHGACTRQDALAQVRAAVVKPNRSTASTLDIVAGGPMPCSRTFAVAIRVHIPRGRFPTVADYYVMIMKEMLIALGEVSIECYVSLQQQKKSTMSWAEYGSLGIGKALFESFFLKSSSSPYGFTTMWVEGLWKHNIYGETSIIVMHLQENSKAIWNMNSFTSKSVKYYIVYSSHGFCMCKGAGGSLVEDIPIMINCLTNLGLSSKQHRKQAAQLAR
ncbi:hypothetical protein EJB05_51110, partial [Eragrostis curvula]